jgi:tetratricopeptide (TPR) repeat protein
MTREPSDNRRRLAALAGLAVLWGALLVAVGIHPLPVATALVLGVGVAAVAFQGRRGFEAVSGRARRIDWAGLRDGARRRGHAAARIGGHGASAARRTAGRAARAGSERAIAAGRAAREIQLPRLEPDRRREAMRLNERAAACRNAGQLEEAIALGEAALEIFQSLEDRRGKALTLNGLGLAQARIGDEAGALDSLEMAVALLTELGDSHGAGRVLANLGALHRGQGHDEQARAYLHDALERLDPGSVEHDRTAQQLRLAG